MKNTYLAILLNLACFVIVDAQEVTLLGTEQLYSRQQFELVGPVHIVLSSDATYLGDGASRNSDTLIWTFDEKGKTVESLYHDALVEIHSGRMGRLDNTTYYVYDTKDRLTKSIYFEPELSCAPCSTREYIYDSSGRLIEIDEYASDKTVLEKSLFTYDPEKRQAMVKWFSYRGADKDPSPTLFVYKFNDKGQIVERTTLKSDGSLVHRIVYSYDEKGNRQKESHYGEKNEFSYAFSYAYKYDAHGNWIERTKFDVGQDKGPEPNDKGSTITYRVITYYGRAK